MGQKNILLLMTDQQRWDYVGYHPEGCADTPNLNRIAAHAYFTGCNTTNPICTPARTSLITGRYTRQIGTLTMAGDLFPQIPTFMQALQKAGYTTYGIGKFHYLQTYPWSTPRGCGMDMVAGEREMKKFGYDFIWETAGKQQAIGNYCFYCDYLNEKGMLDEVRDFFAECGGKNGDTADHNFDKALPWPFAEEDYIDVVTGRVACGQLEKHAQDTPFYMKVSFCGPHKPYDAPKRYLDMFPLERKDDFILAEEQQLSAEEKEILYRQRRSAKAMIKLIDDQIGEILSVLEARDLLKDTLILFTSDHGDMLGDHYMLQKGVPWMQALRVPLAAWLPGQEPIGENHSPVEISDIAAAILDYAGLNPGEALSRDWPAYNNIIPSRSFLPILAGKVQHIRDFTFSESDFTEERHETGADEVRRKRGAGGRRANAWQCITTETTKYIKYLGYGIEETPYEEFYHLAEDSGEQNNLIGEEAWQPAIAEARRRLGYIIDHYPPAQKTWSNTNTSSRKINLKKVDG